MLRLSAWRCLRDCIDDSTAYGNIRQCYNVKGNMKAGLRQNCKPGEECFLLGSFLCLCPHMSFNMFQTFQGPGARKPLSGSQGSHCSTSGLLPPGPHPLSNQTGLCSAMFPHCLLGLVLHGKYITPR